MFLILASFFLLLPKRVLRFILQNKVKTDKILEVILVFPFITVLAITSVNSSSLELLLFVFFAFAYIMIYLLYSGKIIGKLKYKSKLYNLDGFINPKSKNCKIFYMLKISIIFLLLYYKAYQDMVDVFLMAVSIVFISIFYFKQRKNKHDIEIKTLNEQSIEELDNYAPQLVFYFSGASKGFLYHITMWTPYLKASNLKFYIMVRERKYINQLTQLVDDIPIVIAAPLGSVEKYLPSSVKLACYANNGTKNTHLVRFNNLLHIQMLHGDSEKPPSFNPVSKMYDKLFVSGQRAIDRYSENGVVIPQDNFEIVGRPQISDINLKTNLDKENYSVLIAPTWFGFHQDTMFSSLFQIYRTLEYLVSAYKNIKIILRLHPLTNRDDPETAEYLKKIEALLAGSNHILYSDRDIVEDFNESDCIVTDISSVPIDYLYSEKPIVHIDVNNLSEYFKTDRRYKEYSKCVYMIDNRDSNIKEVFHKVFKNDILYENRKIVKSYYHGSFDRPVEEVFTSTIEKLYELQNINKL